jgi:hypothetical protein
MLDTDKISRYQAIPSGKRDDILHSILKELASLLGRTEWKHRTKVNQAWRELGLCGRMGLIADVAELLRTPHSAALEACRANPNITENDQGEWFYHWYR